VWIFSGYCQRSCSQISDHKCAAYWPEDWRSPKH